MKKILLFLVTGFLISAGGLNSSLQAQSEKLYSVNSKDVGWASIDATITEIERHNRTSLLEVEVTNFTQESGADGRFLFCFIFNLAQQRGFRYALWSKCNQEDNKVFVVFLKSEDEDVEDRVGSQANKHSFYDHAMDSEAWEWKKLQSKCGF